MTAGHGHEANSRSAAPPPAHFQVFRYTVPAVCLALFAGLGFWRVRDAARVQAALAPAAADADDTPVAVVHPRRSDASQNVTFPGNVQAFVETPIYARTAGTSRNGTWISAAQVQGRTTPRPDRHAGSRPAASSRRRPRSCRRQANLDLAKTTAERWQNLLKSDGVSQQEVDQNLSAYKARQADFQAAVANVDRLKYLQSFQRVTAPFSGVITARNVDIGALIANGNSQHCSNWRRSTSFAST